VYRLHSPGLQVWVSFQRPVMRRLLVAFHKSSSNTLRWCVALSLDPFLLKSFLFIILRFMSYLGTKISLFMPTFLPVLGLTLLSECRWVLFPWVVKMTPPPYSAVVRKALGVSRFHWLGPAKSPANACGIYGVQSSNGNSVLPVSVIRPVLHSHSFIRHRRHINLQLAAWDKALLNG
jgi:hypothetical protein